MNDTTHVSDIRTTVSIHGVTVNDIDMVASMGFARISIEHGRYALHFDTKGEVYQLTEILAIGRKLTEQAEARLAEIERDQFGPTWTLPTQTGVTGTLTDEHLTSFNGDPATIGATA